MTFSRQCWRHEEWHISVFLFFRRRGQSSSIYSTLMYSLPTISHSTRDTYLQFLMWYDFRNPVKFSSTQNSHTFIHLAFIYLCTHWCARHCSRHRRYSSNQNIICEVPAFIELTLWEQEVVDNKQMRSLQIVLVSPTVWCGSNWRRPHQRVIREHRLRSLHLNSTWSMKCSQWCQVLGMTSSLA